MGRSCVEWSKGEATTLADFGDPIGTHDYSVCVYDESHAPTVLFFGLPAPAGGTCGGGPCWTAHGTDGFDYNDPAGARCGLQKLSLTAGDTGKARIKLKAKGPGLPFGPVPPPLPLRVQLQAGNGNCWGVSYSAAGTLAATSTKYKGKSD